MNVQAVIDKASRRIAKKRAAETDTVLGRVVGVIVHQFKGDTGAFFDSIRTKHLHQERDDAEATLVRRFAKSL
jgi:hypothetical protein